MDTPIEIPQNRNPRGFTELAKKWHSEDLYRAAEAVEATMASPGWEVIQKLIGERTKYFVREVAHAIVTNQNAAAQKTGEMTGMQAAEEAAEAILKAAAEKRSELEQTAAQSAREAA
jgi:hypothetical protein